MIRGGDNEPGLVQSGDTRQKAPGSSHPHSKPLDVHIRLRVVKYVGQSPTAAGSGAGARDGHYGCTHSLQQLPVQTRWGSPASANGGPWSTVTLKELESGVLPGGLVTEFLACLLHWDRDPRGQTRNGRWGASPKVSHLRAPKPRAEEAGKASLHIQPRGRRAVCSQCVHSYATELIHQGSPSLTAETQPTPPLKAYKDQNAGLRLVPSCG